MNGCSTKPSWVVVGAAITADGEAVSVVLAACDRHVVGVKSYVADCSEDLDETPVVLGFDVWDRDFRRQIGLPLGTLVDRAAG